ncbi:LIC12192 family sporadic carbohydrate cluster protein [Candidatus Pelagibacter sp.]|uniref:LIC12192 family sporadic carbohydrate cluster protein n=1 Tax=Candidatus Pelagibacter sp. TaxID=2024849 RepID=UPI003D14C1E6
MKKKLTLRGYISSREALGKFYPQKIQNLIIREFCKIKNFSYMLSAAEYKMKNSFLVLNEIIKDLNNVDGIVAFSLYQFPENKKNRNNYLKKILNKKRIMSFALEEIIIRKKSDIDLVDDLWGVKKTILNKKKPWK